MLCQFFLPIIKITERKREDYIGNYMLIGDLEKDTTVTIHVTDGTKAVQLSSQVLELSKTDQQACLDVARKLDYQSCIGIKAIMAGDRLVSFSSENISCTVTALKNNKPYSWKNVKIARMTLPEQGLIHLVLSSDDMGTFNRRNEYRLFLGREGICRFGDNPQPHNVMIKDISCSGLGMIINKSDKIEISSGMEVEIQFLERGSDDNNQKFTLKGKIVRYVSMGNDKELVGCRLAGRHPELEKMIYEKQRKSMTTDHKPQVKRESTRTLAKELAALAAQNSGDS